MKRTFLLALLAPIALAGSVQAAADYLLEIDGIKGESADPQRPETIEIQSFSWGMSNSASTSGGGGGAGKVSFSDMHFTTKISKATPQLLIACATTNPIPRAILFVRKAGTTPQEYYTVTMQNVLVSSTQHSGASSTSSTGGDPVPTEQLSLNFERITITHIADDGTVTTGSAVRTREE